MKISRQQRRYLERQIAKVDPRLLKEFERQAFAKGITVGIEIMEDGLKKEFGFGKKRLKRLAETIEKNLRKEKEE